MTMLSSLPRRLRMFGDAGIGHVTQCREHRDELAFGCACS
jgi:hypothetical protein